MDVYAALRTALTLAALLGAASFAQAAPAPALAGVAIPGAPRTVVDAEGSAAFRKAGVEGAFVLLDVSRNTVTVVDPRIAASRHVPCSTFKIPNTLVGLETGVIPGPAFALRWDGVHRGVEAWNGDHTLATAMRDSVVWFYQDVARNVGLERMRAAVRRLGYGNAEIGQAVDRFWLDGPLAISPLEQVAFLRRLQTGALPVTPDHAALVRQLIVLEQAPGYTFRAKTGLGRERSAAVGWLVGDVELGERRYVFATLALEPSGDVARVAVARRPVTDELLVRHGVTKPSP